MTWHKRLENVSRLLLFKPYYDIFVSDHGEWGGFLHSGVF